MKTKKLLKNYLSILSVIVIAIIVSKLLDFWP